ncbi:hypothetical protein CFD26_102463 [Aspergillus turcosus]|uniref:Uncharacterized protein n=1 Tax=Aspergillus turcosus TaxID=1245748 RepID=A0A421CVB5_9EURO|nr:hypothetical protein CFD26_102463 [Aspergillus turcosus]
MTSHNWVSSSAPSLKGFNTILVNQLDNYGDRQAMRRAAIHLKSTGAYKSFGVEALPDIPVSLVKQEYITSGMLHESTCQKGKEYCIDESPTLFEIYLGYKPLGRQSEHPLSALYEGDNQRLPHVTMVVEHYSEEEAGEGIRTHDLAYILWRRKCGNGPEYLSPRYNASGQDTGFGDTQPFKVFKQDFDEEQSHFDSDYTPQL